MKRPILFSAVIFIAGLGLGLGFFARSAFTATLERKDLAAIEKLHQEDIAATLTQDPSALTSLWSADAVNLQFPDRPVVGIKAMGEAYQKFRTQYPDFKVLKYAPHFEDIQIADGWAIEVMSGESTYKISAKDNPVTVQGTGMRVLKRQTDGSWKFALVGLR
jgi:ketosteroid isomerase-like protein